jgi:hypothetical protein
MGRGANPDSVYLNNKALCFLRLPGYINIIQGSLSLSLADDYNKLKPNGKKK